MRGKDNSNKIATKELANLLSRVFKMSKLVTTGTLKVITEALVHKVCEEALESETKLNHVDMELPNIGKLSIDIENNKVVSSTIELEDEFKEQIITAVTTGESPLVKDAERSLVERLQKQYRSLI